jgi:4-hydroxy-2-oxoheptanedioate aldolase
MPAPKNRFKQALREGRAQTGLWLGLANAYTAEIAAGAGFDWLLIDGEHAPNDLPLMLAQLQAIAASAGQAVVRLPIGEAWLIKQVLDIGAQTLLIPMVEAAAQADALVRAAHYPPAGIRGVGAALARASNFNRIGDYLQTANEEICLLLQVESAKGLAAIEDIAALPGVDGIFIGPSDLAADMGFIGKPGSPAVQAAVEDGLKRIVASGKAGGILTADLTLARRYQELGATFVAIGSDVGLFTQSLVRCLSSFQNEAAAPARTGGTY